MQYFDEEINKIMNEYDAKRAQVRLNREKTIEAVYKKLPQIKALDERINTLGLENFGKILKNPEKSKEYNEEFERQLNEIKKEKEQILENNNIPKDYDHLKYNCEKCLDTGYIDREKCSCFKQKLIKMRYKMSNLENNLNDFDDFSLDYYSNKKISALNKTEKENMEDILKISKDFCENEGEKNLLFYGSCGLGKTFLSSCIAKRMMDKGKSVLYMTATSLFSEYEDYKFGKKEVYEFNRLREILYDCDCLVLDDLGVEIQSQLATQFFLDILEKRLANGKKIIINTNLSINGLESRYTKRFISRLYESFKILGFYGEDIRLIKLRNGGN